MEIITAHYSSALGKLFLAADSEGLTGLWMDGPNRPDLPEQPGSCAALAQAKHWLDIYFSGQVPDFLPPLHLVGTPFQRQVWNLLLDIPYGQTLTYGQLARALGPRMSAQAVGGAVGRNPVSIIVPCHRVLGVNGRLTGYAWGLPRKEALLRLERIL